MIYEVRLGALAKPTVFRLEDGVLIKDGPRAARFELAVLKRVELADGTNRLAPCERILTLWFGRRRVAISSHSFGRLGLRTDHSADFTPFARAVLTTAAAAAPKAAFLTGGRTSLGIYGAVLGILAAGLVLTLIATLAAGQRALGVDLGARIAFILALLACPLFWLKSWRARTFDPMDPPL